VKKRKNKKNPDFIFPEKKGPRKELQARINTDYEKKIKEYFVVAPF
jgi:hypothetical protein